MRFALPRHAVGRDTGPIRADGCRWFGSYRANVVFRHATHQYAGGTFIRDDNVEDRIEFIEVLGFRDIGDGLSRLGRAMC